MQPLVGDPGDALPSGFRARILTETSATEALQPWVSTTVPVEVAPRREWGERLRQIAGAGPLEVVTNDEYCLEQCAALRRELGLPTRLDISFAAWRDKVVMKEALAAAGVAVPAFLALDPVPAPGAGAVEEILAALGPRIVAKPRREANNRGIAVIDSPAKLERWLGEHAGEEGWEVESFLEGTMFHANALVEAGRVTPLLVGEYIGSPLALERGAALGSVTVPPGQAVARQGRELNRKVVAALGGGGRFVTHTEFVLEPSGRVVFLETAARAPGALISDISLLHTGVHLEQLNLRLQAGLVDASPSPTGLFAGWLWLPRRSESKPAAPPRCEYRLEHHPAPYPIAHSLLAWDPDPGHLREELLGMASCSGG